MNRPINNKMSFKYSLTLISVVLISILVGRAGTAYLIGNDSDLTLYFTFVVTAIVSFLLSYIIVSPKLKAISLKKFLTSVLPLFLVFLAVLGFILNRFTTLI